MRKNYRDQRLGEEIKKIISQLLQRELKHPALNQGIITISHVKSAQDGSFATVYFTGIGLDEGAVIDGFNQSKGFIRTEIGKAMGLRFTPDLRFKVDETEQYGQHIDELISRVSGGDSGSAAGMTAVSEAGMTANVSVSEIVDLLESYERFLLFPHVSMDGDTLGAAVAICLSLRELGKRAYVVIDEEIPDIIEFIEYKTTISIKEAEALELENYLSILPDSSDVSRIETRGELFSSGKESLCIDHHITGNPTCDYNIILPEVASTCEIVYDILTEADYPMHEEIATALYVGILTDTGRFQYESTRPQTHRIAASLMEKGVDVNRAFNEVYQKLTPSKLFVEKELLEDMEIFADGKAAVGFITRKTLDLYDAKDADTEGMSEKLRSIVGVEVSVFARELADGRIKTSMRSKNYFDVAALAAKYGGGGHIRAAGFTSEKTMEETLSDIKKSIEAGLMGDCGSDPQ
ncbi:MAG: 30S ribosome-binding factor RbfA [Clostridiales Family XIII bacterium]|jgi:phosphoesterase RecJ-like protein|nr:30S ribosome-binding factor RbfA [Clostridiales Family XIII bacterium]